MFSRVAVAAARRAAALPVPRIAATTATAAAAAARVPTRGLLTASLRLPVLASLPSRPFSASPADLPMSHAPGVANPAAAVAARKAARAYSYDNLVASAAVAVNANAAKGATVTVALADKPCADAAATVIFVTEGQVAGFAAAAPAFLPAGAEAGLSAVLAAQNFTGKAKTCAVLAAGAKGEKTVLVGLGAAIEAGSDSGKAFLELQALRTTVHVAVDKVKQLKAATANFVLPGVAAVPVSAVDNVALGCGVGVKPVAGKTVTAKTPAQPASAAAVVDAVARVLVTSNWQWDKYWKADAAAEKAFVLTAATIVTPDAATVPVSVVADAVAVGESIVLAREFGNERADVLHPAEVQALAEKLGAAHPESVTVRTLNYDELLADGYNLITAVGQAAVVPPRLVSIAYDGVKDSSIEWTAFVGKGLCYDTGGLNLKPTGAMETMYMDKCGAAAVFGAIRALATLKAPVKVVAVLAVAENAIGSKAYKPYAIIDSHAGSVQVGNTDAEGRLCLADALTFVQNEFKPTRVVDVATLTGACVVALGEHAAGLFSNSDAFAADLAAAGMRYYERNWRLPMLPEFGDEIKGEDADINSTGRTRWGGACTAATFLQHYVQAGVEWAHLDVAGPASAGAARAGGFIPKNSTGYGVQTLVEYALAKAGKQ